MSVGDQNTKYDIDPKEFDKAINALGTLHVKFNSDFDVPYLAGTSIDGKTIYRDHNTGDGYTQKDGKKVNTDRYFCVHERVEDALLKEDFPYILAHQLATRCEYAAVQSDGFDIDEYDDNTQKMVQTAETRKIYPNCPVDLLLTPYKECHDKKTMAKMRTRDGKPFIDLTDSEMVKLTEACVKTL